MPKDDSMSEAEAFLADHPDVETVDLLMPDMCGILRGKRLARDGLGKLFAGDVRAPGSIYLLDANGQSVPTIPYGVADGDSDYFCHAVPGTLKRVPWSDIPMGQVLGTMTDETGTPLYSDPRAILLGGCRPRALADLVPADGWRVIHREVVVSAAIPSEVVIAQRR